MIPSTTTTIPVLALTWEIFLFCQAKPFLDMNRNVAILPQSEMVNDNRSSNEPGPLLASHQDLHPVLLPAPSENSTSSNSSSSIIPQPIATDSEMRKALQMEPVSIDLGHAASTPVPHLNSTVDKNITKLDDLMVKIKQPIPDPNSNVIQPKGPMAAVAAVAAPRDLLPSIVGDSNKDMSSQPVIGSGVPPSTLMQAHGDLPQQMVSNPFGQTPVNIPMGAARELLPSIVAQSNKDTSSQPVEGSGVPPSAVAQAQGQLPKETILNPFGEQPITIPVGKGPS